MSFSSCWGVDRISNKTMSSTTTTPAAMLLKKRPRVELEEKDYIHEESVVLATGSVGGSGSTTINDGASEADVRCYQVVAMPPAGYAKLKELEERAVALEAKTGVSLDELVRRLKHSTPLESS